MKQRYFKGSLGVRLAARSLPQENGCILFDGAVNTSGYGQLKYRNRTSLVHRLVWEAANGAIAEGLCVCHRCDTPRCINIEHLFLGTKADNNADKSTKGRGMFKGVPQITPSEVDRLRQLRESGLTYNAVGKVSGRTYSLVWRVLNAKKS